MIKILYLASNPSDTDRDRLDKEVRTIKEKLRSADLQKRFVVEQEWAVRVTDLEGHLLHHRPRIVHFSGRGSRSGEIVLEDERGQSKPVSPASLGHLFKILKDRIQCVFLDSCYCQLQAQEIRDSIDCVVGMTRAISDDSAVAFAAGFYQGIGFGKCIQTAFDLGLDQVGLQGLPDADVPELLTRDGVDAKTYLIAAHAGPGNDHGRGGVRDEDYKQIKKILNRKYSLIGILGKAHASLISLAYDGHLKRHVAVISLTDPGAERAFDATVRAAACVSKHPNIISIYAAWLDKAPHYYIREHVVDGHSLRIELEGRSDGPLGIDFIQKVFSAVGDAMAFAAERGVTDLDINPENVIIQPRRERLDLGDPSDYSIMLSPEILDKEMIRRPEYLKSLGTNVVYFPPELFIRTHLYASDNEPEKLNQYRLGMLGYEMLAQSGRFQGEAERRATLLTGPRSAGMAGFPPWPPVEEMRQEGCPRFLGAAINRMIARDPEDRFRTLSEAVDAVAGRDLGIEVARDSYRRILRDYRTETEFFRTFYLRFLDARPRAERIFERHGFASRTALEGLDTGNPAEKWPRQFAFLKEAIVLLFAFHTLDEPQKPTILDRIARMHKNMHFPPSYYEAFLNVLVETVVEYDKDNSISDEDIRRSWKKAVEPGIDYMRNFRET